MEGTTTASVATTVSHSWTSNASSSSPDQTAWTSNSTGQPLLPEAYRLALLSIYSIVLVGGTISMSLMISTLQSNVRSFTTVAVINLIIIHILFLLTVPFRMYFYITQEWNLTMGLCRVVSGMIFAHMYLPFVFYIIILVIRYLAFFNYTSRNEFYRKIHAAGASVLVWLLMLTAALPVAIMEYGSPDDSKPARNQCFTFGKELMNTGVAVFNYILSGVIIVTTFALASCQIWILKCIYQKYGKHILSHQDFWAQAKSLGFVIVLLVCFVPYNVFRIYYVKNFREQAGLEAVNELFLAMTALSCMDMVIFFGRGSNRPCYHGCCPCP